MITREYTAKTTEEAIQAGLEDLSVSISEVNVEVLQEGAKGLFGLFGSKQAKVRLTLKEDDDNLLDSLMTDKPAQKPAVKAEAPSKAEPAAAPAASAAESAPKAEPAVKQPREKKQPAEKTEKPVREKKAAEPSEKPAKKPAEKKPLPPKEPVKPLEKPVVTVLNDDQIVPDSAAARAKEFVTEMTRLMGVDVTMEVGTDADGNVYVSMTGDTLGILIGRRGETLDALQYLTSLKVNRGQENYTRVTLDTENYRAKREDTLIRLANRMANRAVKSGRKVSLEPMNPYERRIIHSALQANDAVDTHSEGEEPNRHVVITLRK